MCRRGRRPVTLDREWEKNYDVVRAKNVQGRKSFELIRVKGFLEPWNPTKTKLKCEKGRCSLRSREMPSYTYKG